MNQKDRLIAYLARFGITSCEALERVLHIRSVTTRVSEINKKHRSIHHCELIKATERRELNGLGQPHTVTYYEIDTSAVIDDLFQQQ
jgi:hypothetical protein